MCLRLWRAQALSKRCFGSRGSIPIRPTLAALGHVSPISTNTWQSSGEIGRCWPNFGRRWPMLTKIWPTSANVGRTGPTFRQHLPKVGKLNVGHLDQYWPIISRRWPNLGTTGKKGGPDRAMLTESRPKLGYAAGALIALYAPELPTVVLQGDSRDPTCLMMTAPPPRC